MCIFGRTHSSLTVSSGSKTTGAKTTIIVDKLSYAFHSVTVKRFARKPGIYIVYRTNRKLVCYLSSAEGVRVNYQVNILVLVHKRIRLYAPREETRTERFASPVHGRSCRSKIMSISLEGFKLYLTGTTHSSKFPVELSTVSNESPVSVRMVGTRVLINYGLSAPPHFDCLLPGDAINIVRNLTANLLRSSFVQRV